MREEEFLKALSYVDDKYLIKADTSKKRKYSIVPKLVGIAAAIAIFAFAGADVMDRMDMGRSGCSALLGDVANGKYYFYESKEGVFSYDETTGNVKKELDTFFMDGYIVDDYGIFYNRKCALYVKEHETGKTRKIFSVSPLTATNIDYEFAGNAEDIIITVFNRNSRTIYKRVIDGLTGEDISEKYPDIDISSMSYSDYENCDEIYSLGDKKYICHSKAWLVDDNWQYDNYFAEKNADGTEKKIEAYDAEFVTVKYSDDDIIVLDYLTEHDSVVGKLIIGGGNDIRLEKDIATQISIIWGHIGDDIIYENGNQKKYVYNLSTGDNYKLKLYDKDLNEFHEEEEYEDFYSVRVYKDKIYSCAPWDDSHKLWEPVYDNDKIIGAKLIDTFGHEKRSK